MGPHRSKIRAVGITHLDYERLFAVLKDWEQSLKSDGDLFPANAEKAAHVDYHAENAPRRIDQQIIDRSNLLFVRTPDRSSEILRRKQSVTGLVDDVEAAGRRRGWRFPKRTWRRSLGPARWGTERALRCLREGRPRWRGDGHREHPAKSPRNPLSQCWWPRGSLM